MSKYSCVIINFFLIVHLVLGHSNSSESCVKLFEQGVEAYLENRFEECVTNFEKSIDKYRTYRKKLVNCRLKCKNEAELSDPLYHVDIENLSFYEKAVRQTLCLIQCENESLEIMENYNVNNDIEKLFEEHKPYEYLQLCYFQVRISTCSIHPNVYKHSKSIDKNNKFSSGN